MGSWQNITWTYKNLLFTIVTISLYYLIAKIWQPRHFCKQKISDVLTCGSLFYDLQDRICQIIVELIIDFIVHGSPIWQEFLLINTFRLIIYFYIEINKNKVLYCFSLASYTFIKLHNLCSWSGLLSEFCFCFKNKIVSTYCLLF